MRDNITEWGYSKHSEDVNLAKRPNRNEVLSSRSVGRFNKLCSSISASTRFTRRPEQIHYVFFQGAPKVSRLLPARFCLHSCISPSFFFWPLRAACPKGPPNQTIQAEPQQSVCDASQFPYAHDHVPNPVLFQSSADTSSSQATVCLVHSAHFVDARWATHLMPRRMHTVQGRITPPASRISLTAYLDSHIEKSAISQPSAWGKAWVFRDEREKSYCIFQLCARSQAGWSASIYIIYARL